MFWQQQTELRVTRVSNGMHVPLEASASATQVTSYNGFLRLEGVGATPGGRLRFLVLAGTTQVFNLGDIPTERAEWSHTIRPTAALPDTILNAEHNLIVQSADTPPRNAAPVKVVFKKDEGPLPVPTISAPTYDTLLDKKPHVTALFGKSALVKDKIVTVTGTISPEMPDARVLIYAEGITEPLAISEKLQERVNWKAELRDLKDGKYKLYAVSTRGQRTEGKSIPLELALRRHGPRIIDVSPPDFGTAPGVKTLTIRFDPENPVTEKTVLKATPYFLRAGGANGAFDGTNTNHLTILDAAKQIQFDEARNLVRLTFDNLTPAIYRLEIKGTLIEDEFGNLLEQTDGAPGKDYHKVLSEDSALLHGGLASTTRGISGEPAPYVPYSEFTKPRKPPDGANPSDRVETRVARLYYYRDAHRVAQIINRDARSYNRQAVEVRRRMADKARDDANRLTDERRASERAAVQAASTARGVEKQLAEAQQAVADARARARTAQDTATRLRQSVQNAQLERPATQLEQQQEIGDAQRDLSALRARRKEDETRLRDLQIDLDTLRRQRAANEEAFKDQELRRNALPARLAGINSRIDADEKEILRLQQMTGGTPAEIAQRAAVITALQTQLAQARNERNGVEFVEPNQIRLRILDLTQQLQQNNIALGQRNADLQQVTERIRATDMTLAGGRQQLTPAEEVLQNTARLRLASDQAAAEATAEAEKLKAAENRVTELQGQLQQLRQSEVRTNEEAIKVTANEDRAKEEQFRREVAAAHEDPDTFAPGVPDSDDPVRQVSISVIGEGIIQLRGPIKGINVIREMINQIDAPVGQVRIAVHTVQLNGEHGDRMEKISACIQRYIDHSRFLTMQSAQMLRNSIVYVASQKAEMAYHDSPFDSQEARDHRYLRAFFGNDFVKELESIDSEFLRTGNKLLSLHSMDTTSLASALFVFALAKNSTRTEILARFEQMMCSNLPAAEHAYFEAGGKKDHCCKFQFLSRNARFRSLLGFFDHDVHGSDTLNPLQREFIRLAQIFKSRLITELELKQRVMERTIIEERLGDYLEDLKKQRKKEAEAEYALNEARQMDATTKERVGVAMSEIMAEIARIRREAEALGGWASDTEREVTRHLPAIRALPEKTKPQPGQIRGRDTEFFKVSGEPHFKRTEPLAQRYITQMKNMRDFLGGFFLEKSLYQELQNLNQRLRVIESGDYVEIKELLALMQAYKRIAERVLEETRAIEAEFNKLIVAFSRTDIDRAAVYQAWVRIRERILSQIKGELLIRTQETRQNADKAFRDMLLADAKVQSSRQSYEESRRQLDHKKILDMFIDEYHDKYVELLEGTRAHTANIDNYIKSLSTALDDDFNTQFYNPTFREIRTAAARFWDVSLSKIESTSILTNNRAFGKVSPEATMEFDLPRRDILITEAAKGAKALMQEHGALLQDPTFLSLMKLRSGQPTSSPVSGSTGGLSTVRNVLPGLPSGTEERVLSQGGPGRREFGAALEALIPDPAIYKFETGTGYEIRPVISPDGQAVVFHFNYMYTTNIREPVRADEKHLGRVKRHFIDTDVQLSNYEMREVSRYIVGLKASRTSRGVPLLEDIPGVGLLFRPLPQSESSLQQNLIYAQSTIFPTLFDLMGLRWAPAVADLDALRLRNEEFVVRGRRRDLMHRAFDYSTGKVDEFMRTPVGERRTDLYRSQETIPHVHPNGYMGPGLNQRDSHMQEGYKAPDHFPPSRSVPSLSPEGTVAPAPGPGMLPPGTHMQRGPVPSGFPAAPVSPLEVPHSPQSRRPGTQSVIQAGHSVAVPQSQPPPPSKPSTWGSIKRFFGKSDK